MLRNGGKLRKHPGKFEDARKWEKLGQKSRGVGSAGEWGRY